MAERYFDFARKMEGGVPVVELDARGVEVEVHSYRDALLPEYQSKYSAGADFFCAEEVVIPSLWKQLFSCLFAGTKDMKPVPTLVHTGIKARMEKDEVLELYNRSSNPGKLGLILANSVGVVDADYFNNVDNDGEIMFAFYNFMPWSVTVKVGDRIGQGVFKKYLRPVEGLRVKDAERVGGIGSTDSNNNVSLSKEVNN